MTISSTDDARAADSRTATARTDRNASLDAILALEAALASPSPGRSQRWLERVIGALDVLDEALATQTTTDHGADSLLSVIGESEPRFLPRIKGLRRERRDLQVHLESLRHQLDSQFDGPEAEIDVADVRDRLSSLARRFRRYRARESDLVFEAINVDLGSGD